MAASVLVERGWELERAITEVRRVRPGAIERAAQEAAVRGWGSVTTMTKSQENSGGYSLKEMVKIAEKMGYGDDPFTKALKAGAEGKTVGGLPLAKGQRVIIAGLKDHLVKTSPRKK